MMKTAVITTALLLLSAALLAAQGAKRTEGGVSVARVNDGDTITVVVGSRREHVRLIGIDAPELGQPPWGRMARDYLKKLMASSSWSVTLEYDIVPRDKYGRILAYVRTMDGRLVNEEMLRAGYAVLFTFPPNVRYVERFTAVQREARRKGIGIWGRDGLKELPVDWRRQHPRRK